MKISLAPLQGYTDWVFRQAYQKCIGSVDEYYTPFLVLQNTGTLKTSHRREVEPFDERSENLIPQFLCSSVEEFQFFQTYFRNLGYTKMNWNLGCPFPMVVRKGKGSGLLQYPEQIREILKEGFSGQIALTVKMRLGLSEASEIFPVLDVLKEFNIDEIIIHPRIGKQLYKGEVDREGFARALDAYGKPVAYNGDVDSVEAFQSLMQQFPDLNHVMIGRGVLKDYWLPSKIKGIKTPSVADRKFALQEMHKEVFSVYSSFLSGDSQILQKMKPFWEYFSFHFENERKVFKAIKKSSGIAKYNEAVRFAFQQNLKE